MKISKVPGVLKVELRQRGSEAQGVLEADREIAIEEINRSLSGTLYEARVA